MVLYDCPIYTLKGQPHEDTMFLHFNYKPNKFTKSVYENLLVQWSLILDEIKSQGYKYVASVIDEDWSKERKWQVMFGLSPEYQIEHNIFYRMEL